MGKPILVVKDLSVEVDGHTILDGINIEVYPGEITVLMGPNGSGKSTLLYTIMGLRRYRVLKGSILFNGVDITNEPPWTRALRGIALAFQNPPRIPVRLEYIAKKIAEKHGVKGVVSEYASSLKIDRLMNRNLFHGFSGGEIKRTELYLLVIKKPRLALLDEPDSGVDIDSIREIAHHINMLTDNGAGVLLVTHQGYILKYQDDLGRGYVMYNGRIIYSDTVFNVSKKVLLYGYSKLVKEVTRGL